MSGTDKRKSGGRPRGRAAAMRKTVSRAKAAEPETERASAEAAPATRPQAGAARLAATADAAPAAGLKEKEAGRLGPNGAGLPHPAGQVVALAAAHAVLLRGCEELGREIASHTRRTAEEAVRATRALFAARTAADLLAVNRDCAQAALEALLAHTARLSEIGIRTAADALAPLGESAPWAAKPRAK